MKKNLLVATLILIFILPLQAEENFFEKLNKGKYLELINRINEDRDEDIDLYSQGILNGILMISYMGIEDYKNALLYSRKIEYTTDTHTVRPYETIVKYKNDHISLEEALADFESLMISTNYSYNIYATIVNFQIEHGDFDNAENYLEKISANFKNDTGIFSIKCYLILKKGNIANFINKWIYIKSDDIEEISTIDTPFIRKNIVGYLEDNNQNLILSIFYYINEEFDKSEEIFTSFLSEHCVESQSDLIDMHCKDFSNEIVDIVKTLYNHSNK
jgi:tetratricopeptide (TPR) repeat protein